MKNLAIIPARSGSKGLKDKNIRMVCGKPLLAYTIEAAEKSGIFEAIHVSTDSEDYKIIAEQYGAEVPFLRDVENARDSSSSWDVVREVIRKYSQNGQEFDNCFLLQPTSPLRTSENIKEAFDEFLEKKASTITSVSKAPIAVQLCFKLDESKSMKSFVRSPYKYSRRQDLDTFYLENGAIYITKTKEIIDPDFDFYNDSCYAYIMEEEESIDIDTIRDIYVVEAIMKMNDGNISK